MHCVDNDIFLSDGNNFGNGNDDDSLSSVSDDAIDHVMHGFNPGILNKPSSIAGCWVSNNLSILLLVILVLLGSFNVNVTTGPIASIFLH